MHIRSVALSVLIVLSAFGFHAASVSASELEAAEYERLNPLLTLGGLTTENYTEGIGDVVIPLHFNGAGLLYLNPRFSFTDRSEEEYNIGIGYRHLLSEGQAIGGVNVFYDRRDTAAGSTFDQVGLGAEYLTHYVDLRANVYLPLDTKELVDEFSTVEESVARRTSRSSETQWNDPYGRGNSILQDLETIHRQRTRTTRTTMTRYFEQYEIAMRGWDAELGGRLPLEQVDDYVRLKAFGGYYKYHGRRGLDDIDGFRGRLEVHIKPSFVVDAVYYEDDELTGGNYSIGAYVSVPLDLANLANGRNPFAGAAERWDAGAQSEDLTYRLTDMVRRDPQIRTLMAEPEERPDLMETTSETRTREEVVGVERRTATVATDITFVDGTRGSDANPGTFEAPKNTVQGGVDQPRSMVFVHDIPGAYNENVVMTEGVYLRGSGSPIPAFGGKYYGSGVPPVIDGRSMGPTVTMADQTIIRGFSIRNTDLGGPEQFVNVGPLGPYEVSRVGIFGDNATDLTIMENRIGGNSTGVLLAREGDFNLTFLNNGVFNNDEDGLLVDAIGSSGTFNALIQGSGFTGNAGFGALIESSNYDFSLAHLRNNFFTGNRMGGLGIAQFDNELAMALVSGAEANNNVDVGIGVLQVDNDVALMNLSDVTANNNEGTGIFFLQDNFVSVGIMGMPEGMGDMVGGIADLVGLGIPPELKPFFEATGPVTANGNAEDGVFGDVVGDFLALGGFFDITANGNGLAGFDVIVDSDALAFGFAGSSKNFAEILELGSDVAGLLGLDLPLGISGTGQMQANNNALGGVFFDVYGDVGAVGVLAGIETANNDDFGTFFGVGGGLFAIGAAARLESTGNAWNAGMGMGGGGLMFDVRADDLALGIIADSNVSGNNGFGIDANVESDGVAALLTLSTDALRPLANLLGEALTGEPYELPGQPYGPVTVNNNMGPGLIANVDGGFLALGAFIDTHANNNEALGFDVNISADNGGALGFFASSDQLYEIGTPLISDLLFGDPNAIPVPAFPPMGPLQAIGNQGGGMDVNLEGETTTLIMLGVDASNNTDTGMWGGPGYGIGVNAESEFDTLMLLGHVSANQNAGDGLQLNAFSDQFVETFLFQVAGNANQGRGIDVTAESEFNDVMLIMSGIDTHDNAMQGTRLALDAGDDLLVALTDTHSSGNMLQGFLISADAERDATILITETATIGPVGFLPGLVTAGPSTFVNNGLALPPPAAGRAGLRMTIEAGEDIVVAMDGDHVFSGNTGNGLNSVLNSGVGNITVAMDGGIAENNARNGIRFLAETDAGDINMALDGVTASWNSMNGIVLNATSEGGDGDITMALNDVTANNNVNNGLRLIMDSTVVPGDLSLTIDSSEALNNGNWDIFSRQFYTTGGSAMSAVIDTDRDTENMQQILVP